MVIEKISKMGNIQYIGPGNTLYGAPGIEKSERTLRYARIIIGWIIIPLILIIGLIVYNKKSKSNKLNRILISILIILVYIIIMAVIVCKYYNIF